MDQRLEFLRKRADSDRTNKSWREEYLNTLLRASEGVIRKGLYIFYCEGHYYEKWAPTRPNRCYIRWKLDTDDRSQLPEKCEKCGNPPPEKFEATTVELHRTPHGILICELNRETGTKKFKDPYDSRKYGKNWIKREEKDENF